MSAVGRLRQNDPTTTSTSIIYLRREPSDADLAQALQQNPFIREIDLFLENVQTTNWGDLLRVIATRDNLRRVTLMDAVNPEARNAPAAAALVRSILRAIQQNAYIRFVRLFSLRLPADISTFVDTASSITSFELSQCDTERQQGARDLAMALQRNTNIQTLQLGNLVDIYVIPILQGLRSNHSLRTLFLGGTSFSDATTRAIQQLLESTVSSIQTFGLGGMRFENNGDTHTLRTIAQSLIQSQIMSALRFTYCNFRDEGSTAVFRGILQNKQNLTSLCLDNCTFSGGQVHETIVSTLLRPDSPLQTFELKKYNLGDVLPNVRFQNLLRAVEMSKLERFAIGRVHSHQQLRALTDSIPLMRIKVLEVVVESESGFGGENYKQLLLQAVKNNFSLRSVDGNHSFPPERDLFDADDKTRLLFYADRNERLDQWVDNSETVGRKVWPEALKLAEQAGPDSLFRGLRSVLGGDFVKLRAGRKHQRPQYYAPS